MAIEAMEVSSTEKKEEKEPEVEKKDAETIIIEGTLQLAVATPDLSQTELFLRI